MFNTKISLTNNISSHFPWGKTAALALLAASVNANAADPAANHNDAAKKPPVPAAHGPTLESAVEAATAAIEACLDKDQKAGVSVVDAAGVLKVLLAADGASERGVLSSTNKAVTALHFKTATSQLFKQKETDQALAEKIAANSNFNPRPGGVLLKNGDEIIGAIGVGGAKIDEECALAGIDKIEARPK
jgi:uncharacterized protein GlcG (DUF336 family)